MGVCLYSSKNLKDLLLKIQWIFVILLSLFVIKKFQGCMLICWNAEGVHGHRKVRNPGLEFEKLCF